jgi:predicted MFS family arabinose efflux permease
MVDLSMFLEWHFLLMSLSTILLFTWFIVPYFYLAEIMVRNGYSEKEASTLLSIIGLTNFLGMVSALLTRDAPSEA